MIVHSKHRKLTNSPPCIPYVSSVESISILGVQFNQFWLACTSCSEYAYVWSNNMRIPLESYIYSICNFRCEYIRFHVRHFDLSCSRIEHGDVTTSSSWIYSHGLFTPFDSIGHQVCHIFNKKLSTPPLLPVTSFDNGLDYFENFNEISSSFDGFRKTTKSTGKYNGSLRYSRKTKWLQLLHPSHRCSRVNNNRSSVIIIIKHQ